MDLQPCRSTSKYTIPSTLWCKKKKKIPSHLHLSLSLSLSPQNSPGAIQFWSWPELGCKGAAAFAAIDDGNYSRNISAAQVSQSFKLVSRGLQGQEQLDLSVSDDVGKWSSTTAPSDDLSCSVFVKSYRPTDGIMSCQNTQRFTCFRLWVNK